MDQHTARLGVASSALEAAPPKIALMVAASVLLAGILMVV
jgi:hypothetical protein